MKRKFVLILISFFAFFLCVGCSDNLNEKSPENCEKLANAAGVEYGKDETDDTKKDTDEQITTGADVPEDAWVWGRIAPNGYVVLSFSAKADKTYMVFWDDKTDGSGKYSAQNGGGDIIVKWTYGISSGQGDYYYSRYESEMKFYSLDNGGYTNGEKLSANKNRTIWLRIGLADNSSAGSFALAVLENNEPVALSVKKYEKNYNFITSLTVPESYETIGSLAADTSIIYYFTVDKDSLCYFFKQGDLKIEFGNNATAFTSDFGKPIYHEDMITLVTDYTGIIFMRLSASTDTKYKFSKAITEYDPNNIVITAKTISNIDYLSSLTESNAVTTTLRGAFSESDISSIAGKIKKQSVEITLDMSQATPSKIVSPSTDYPIYYYYGDALSYQFFSYGNNGIMFGDAFEGIPNLNSVILPDNLHIVGQNAFKNCTSLCLVKIPSSTKILGNYAFAGCSALESLTIPDGIIRIGNNTFQDCTNLKSITIPDSVANMPYIGGGGLGYGQYLFSGCVNLTDVTLSANMTALLNEMFENCTSLKSIKIPKNITYINSDAFVGCTGLSSVIFEDSANWYDREDGVDISSKLADPVSAARYLRSATSSLLKK